MVFWPQVAGFLLVGYLCMTRSFAYLGVPPLFIGEIVLAAFLLLKPRVALGNLGGRRCCASSPLNALGLALLVFVAYGVWQVGRGVLGGSSPSTPSSFLSSITIPCICSLEYGSAFELPDYLPKLIRVLAWVNGIYGLIWHRGAESTLADLTCQDPRSPLFSPPGGGVVAILGLLCFERNLRAVWPVLVLNIVVTLAGRCAPSGWAWRSACSSGVSSPVGSVGRRDRHGRSRRARDDRARRHRAGRPHRRRLALGDTLLASSRRSMSSSQELSPKAE